MATLYQGNQQSLTAMHNLNTVVQKPMTLNAQVRRPESAVDPENITKVHKIVLGDRTLRKMRGLSEKYRA